MLASGYWSGPVQLLFCCGEPLHLFIKKTTIKEMMIKLHWHCMHIRDFYLIRYDVTLLVMPVNSSLLNITIYNDITLHLFKVLQPVRPRHHLLPPHRPHRPHLPCLPHPLPQLHMARSGNQQSSPFPAQFQS